LNSEFTSVTSFTVSYDSSTDSNLFFFGSDETEDVLVSESSAFGRKNGSSSINLRSISDHGGLRKNLGKLFSGVTKRISRAERKQHHCIKVQ
jgi:hypothetical protein